ncbi:cytidine deaminase [Brachybacterium halotolerans subsp. kimchii]|uniref:cytidine deaminase n=1 Tax=Brachybacterium halotolerans TaxID=2795215 RepID=UPI001E540183|nr:cytidine deaminase [Brachybacterium halotolerans]UEJ82532.1 cytidine deaminase [Brachybacterium halotolerans subsp. kimchii]
MTSEQQASERTTRARTDAERTGDGTADFDELVEAARAVAQRAYAPYSRYRVGAAATTDDGRVVTGCNVENAGYGVTLCAECGMVSDLVAGGGGTLRRFVCVGGDEHVAAGDREVVMPCGRCRQLLSEHAGPQFRMLSPHGVLDLEGLLPQAFGPADLAG